MLEIIRKLWNGEESESKVESLIAQSSNAMSMFTTTLNNLKMVNLQIVSVKTEKEEQVTALNTDIQKMTELMSQNDVVCDKITDIIGE